MKMKVLYREILSSDGASTCNDPFSIVIKCDDM